MQTSSQPLLIVAIPPILGSLVVLSIADVGMNVWITHLLAISLGCCLVFVGSYLRRLSNRKITAFAIIILTLLGLATSILGGDSSEPERWISVGPVRLYIAPVLLPSFIGACSVYVGEDSKQQMVSFTAVLATGLLLSLQPDASQVLGLTAASAVVVAQHRLGVFRLGAVAFLLGALTLWAFSLPDPLEPVPHVEEVFALALSHSLFAGLAIIASAGAFIVGLWIRSRSGPSWLAAVASYYMVLFVCSTTGITPAPLLGYGAGPILGFGLMTGLLGWLEHQNLPNKSIQPIADATGD